MTIHTSDLTPAVVTLDDMTRGIPALLPDTRWNGWENPYFRVSDVRAARDVFDALYADMTPDSGYTYRWDVAADLPSIVDDESGADDVAPIIIDGEEYVTIGFYAYCWYRAPVRFFGWEDGFTPYSASLDGDTLTEYAGDAERDPDAIVERRSTIVRRPGWDGHPNAADYTMSDDFSAGEVDGVDAVWIDGRGYALTPID